MPFAVETRLAGEAQSSTHEAETASAALAAALSSRPDVEAYVSWTGIEALCALDLDVETGYEFTWQKFTVLIDSFRPRPLAAWVTHGGGLRLVYQGSAPYSADEIAAVAALNLAETVPYRGMELKRETRHPGGPDAKGRGCGEVRWMEQEFGHSALRRHLGVYEAGDLEVAAWLEEHGMEVGGRYDHPMCPVDPSDRGGRRPVFAGERGICCFVCEAAGMCRGSSRPGFFPYSAFCGRRRATHLYRCLENATHWEHARFVLEHSVDLPPQFARLIYSAGITMLRNREDARRAFAVGENLIRIGDRWCNMSGESYSRDIKPLLASLPACTFADDDGKVRVDRGRVVAFEQSFDLQRYGYPSLVPVFGCRMWPWNGGEAIAAVIQTRELAADAAADFRPKYVEPAKRVPDPWSEFERVFPGIDRNLLLLLVAARGIAEGASSMPPMVFVTGPTGASKTMTVFIAAAVCGDRNTEVVWTSNGDRLRQAVSDGAGVGSFVTFNEVLKEARQRGSERALDYVLNLTPDSVSWHAYIGPTRLGRLPVFVWTDTDLPQEIRTDAQIARRMVHVHLTAELDWREPWRVHGLRHARDFRLSSPERAAAADAVFSEAIDRFLRPPRDFAAVATELGFSLMRDSDESVDRGEVLSAFFDAVCAAPDVSGADAVRWKGRGWKRVDQDVETPIREAWCAVSGTDFFSTRAVGEVDWKRAAKLSEAARVEVRVHGRSIAVRFRSEEGTRKDYRVNQELRRPS